MNNLYKLYDMGFKVARSQWKHETVLIDKQTNKPVGVLILDVFCRIDDEHDLDELALEYGVNIDSSASALRLTDKLQHEGLPMGDDLMWANIKYVYIDKAYRGRNLGFPFIKASCELFGGSCIITSIAECESSVLHAYWLREGFEELPQTDKTKHIAPSIYGFEKSYYSQNVYCILGLKDRCIQEREEARSKPGQFDEMFSVRCD